MGRVAFAAQVARKRVLVGGQCARHQRDIERLGKAIGHGLGSLSKGNLASEGIFQGGGAGAKLSLIHI